MNGTCGHEENIRVCEDCLMKHLHDLNVELKDKNSFKYFINYHWDYLGTESPEEQHEKYLLRLKKQSKERYQNCNISPRTNKLSYTVENINKVIKWAEDWFDENKYSEWLWWAETGKNPDDPKIHLHYIFKKSKTLNTKNHMRQLKASWNATFTNKSKIVNKDDVCSEPFTNEYLNDKIIYAINSCKDTHENFRDLLADPPEGLLRAYGGSNSLTTKLENLMAA